MKTSLNTNGSFNHNDINHATSTAKKRKDKEEKGNTKEELLYCEECNYKCEKANSLKKHMMTKHSDHQFKG